MDPFAILQEQFGFFLLVFTRISGFFVAAPIFGSRNIPATAKIGFAFFLAMIVFPAVPTTETVLPTGVLAYILMIMRELFVGMIVGFVSTFVFSAVQMAGVLLDTQIGFGIINTIDPQSEQQVPLIGNFQYVLAVLVFLITNGHHLLLAALLSTFKLFPLSGMIFRPAMADVVVDMVYGMFIIALKISLPVLVALLLTDVALGILSRTMPQFNIFVVGIPGKILIGSFILSVGLPFYIFFLEVAFNEMYAGIYRLLFLFQPNG